MPVFYDRKNKMVIFTAKFWNSMAKVLSGLCILMILLAAGFGLHSYSFLRTAVVTKARVIELVPRQSNGNTTFAPVFVFEDSEGNKIEKYSNMATYPPVGSVGDTIEILYSPDDPGKSRLNTFFSKWGLPLIVGSLGLFYLIVCGLIIFFTGRHLRKKESDPDGGINSVPLRSTT